MNVAMVARFDNPGTQLAVCRGVRGLWAFLIAVNTAAAIHEAVSANWPMALTNTAAVALIAGAYIGALGPMLANARRAVREARQAHIDDLERELGM